MSWKTTGLKICGATPEGRAEEKNEVLNEWKPFQNMVLEGIPVHGKQRKEWEEF